MARFIFTYGMDQGYPFRGGWTVVDAPDSKKAVAAFRAFHPDRDGHNGVVNCAKIYTEDEFMQTEMYKTDNCGGNEKRCVQCAGEFLQTG